MHQFSLRSALSNPIAALAVALPLVGACDGDGLPFYLYGQDVADADGASDTTPSDTSGGSDTADTTGGSDTQTADTAAGSDTGSDTTSAEALIGAVTVFQTDSPVSEELVTAGISASFLPGAAALGPPVATVGACEVRPTSDGEILFEDRGSHDVGAISVSIAESTYSLDFNGEGYVSDVDPGATEVFVADQSISASGAGSAAFGAFVASVTAPTSPVIQRPDWDFSDSHSRDDDLLVEWAAGAGSQVLINLSPVRVFPEPGIAEGNAITCVVSDTGGFTVPADALGYLPAGAGFGDGYVALTVARLSTTTEAVSPSGEVTLTAAASYTIVGAIP